MINGVLVLVEDQYNVGDWISIAGVSGTVESMSLRKTTVRGGDGTLNIIPNSQITIVSNQSRDYSTTTLNISVDFSADPEKVIALLKEVSLSVAEDPAYKDVFLEPPQVLGVDQIKGPEVIYLLNVKTQARRQYDAIREMQKRLRVALEQNHMLPGSPFRVAARSLEAHTATAPPPAAPSAAKPAADVNPFEPQA
jgi:small conductance mechanosensitive channel